MVNATERKVLTITTFVSSCICFAPGEWVSGLVLLIASGVMYRWYRLQARREEAAKPAPAPAPAPEAQRST